MVMSRMLCCRGGWGERKTPSGPRESVEHMLRCWRKEEGRDEKSDD